MSLQSFSGNPEATLLHDPCSHMPLLITNVTNFDYSCITRGPLTTPSGSAELDPDLLMKLNPELNQELNPDLHEKKELYT